MGGGNSEIFYVHPYLQIGEMIPILTNIAIHSGII